jgi:predicted transcriptional regulator
MAEFRQLTKAEEEIMQYFWELGEVTVSDIIERMEGGKPPHSSVSTIVRILEKKGFVDHKAYGRTYVYFPIVSKEEYSNQAIHKFVEDYFSGSYEHLVSHIARVKDIRLEELQELFDLIDDKPK